MATHRTIEDRKYCTCCGNLAGCDCFGQSTQKRRIKEQDTSISELEAERDGLCELMVDLGLLEEGQVVYDVIAQGFANASRRESELEAERAALRAALGSLYAGVRRQEKTTMAFSCCHEYNHREIEQHENLCPRRLTESALANLPGAETGPTDWERQPTIVCLCGSTRFYREFQRVNYEETMVGNIVLSVGFYMHKSKEAHGETWGCTPEQKLALDELHKRKIDLANEVLVLNVGGYIGESTRSEIDYAIGINTPIRYLEAVAATQEEPADG